MNGFFDWLDNRTGIRGLLKSALYERIPGGARWRYVWGSALSFAIVTQFVTGIVLWASYSANAQGAWESVYYIQTQMLGGWMLRGIHHYMAQATIVLLVIHLMQVVIDGAYRAPREVNFWLGIGLLLTVLGLSLTGYLLPWDQKGYWATKVATSIASMTPVVGPAVQRVLVGGAEYGHLTLTRFFALHAGVLPGALIALIVGHVYLFRRHGVTVPDKQDRPDGMFWPEQVLKDGVAALAVMAAVLVVVLTTGGAELGAPADPTEPYAAARPEWYFLFLYQWLKYFPAGLEVVGAQVIPGFFMALVVAMPIIARWRLGHRFNLGLLVALLLGVGVLTQLARVDDAADPGFSDAVEKAEAMTARMEVLIGAAHGIPSAGALALLRSDPLTQGPRLFASNCSSCHRVQGHDGMGREPTDEQGASDLAGFGSREWLAGLLDPERVATTAYFGATEHAQGRMVRFVQRGVAGFDDDQRVMLGKVLKAVSAEAGLRSQAVVDSVEVADILEGRRLISDEAINCTRCHIFRGVSTDDPVGPELTGWGSREWMLRMVRNPEHESLYGEDNDRMPAFGVEGILTETDMELIVDWLRGEWVRAEDAGG